MGPVERREKLKTLFTRALALPADRRVEFLETTCGSSPDVHRELTSLLASFDSASNYFDRLKDSLLPQRKADDHRRPELPTDPIALVGRTVSDYHILEMLGSGGMGVVYRARHEKLDRLVALKFLPPHLDADADARAQFLREARAASTLDHPNACTIYDIGETATGRPFIAMAYYDGETLKEKLIRGPLPVDEAVSVAKQMANGLAKAHECGIVHRDVTPANVMVTRDGEVKLLDFGLATTAALKQTGATMGTVAYMSPEQAAGEAVDHRTDIWSLGVVLYELLAGRRPFVGDDDRALVDALLHSNPPPLHESIPPEVGQVVYRCLEKDPSHRYQSAGELWMSLHRPGTPRGGGAPEMHRPRVFLSYLEHVGPDNQVAEALAAAFSPHCEILPRAAPLKTEELSSADVLVMLLSAHSIHSEMMVAELEAVRQSERNQPAVIFPVRLATWEPFHYPLSSYLDALDEAYWEGPADTPRLASELRDAITGGNRTLSAPTRPPMHHLPAPAALSEPAAAAQPPRLEMPEGTMNPLSSFYVKRPEDDVALRAIAQQGVTITIKGPRQMGKSSLLIRTMDAARQLGKDVVFLDFQLVDGAGLGDAELFFRQFCVWISDELDLEDRIDEYWRPLLSNSQRCTRYMERYVLKTLRRPVVLAIDEVERVFDTDFRSDFFSMLRSWHNDRAIKPRWKGFDLALVTSTEPYQLIENLNQSPFNVGEVVALSEFTPDQVADLNERHGRPLSRVQLQQLLELLGGHPYLIRKALYLIAGRRATMDSLLATATDEHGPFGDHLRHHLFRLQRDEKLMQGMRQILEKRRCEDESIFWRLRGAGLVRRSDRDVVVSSRLYADFFRIHLNA